MYDGRFNYLLFLLFIIGDTIKQGFKPKSINDIEEGMKVLFEFWIKKYRGTVRYVGPVSTLGNQLGIEIDPGEY